MSRVRSRWIAAVVFLAATGLAFLVRDHHFRHESKRVVAAVGANFIPFTVESAIMYDYALDVANGKPIGSVDPELVGMENFKVNEQMSLGLEYFLGYGYRLTRWFRPVTTTSSENDSYEDDPDFSNWIRFQIRLWTSLTSGLVALWLIAMRCPWWFALFGGALHAVAPAAISRYTGQDLVRGEFCLPLLTAAFALAFWFLKRPGAWKLAMFVVVCFLAMATWDMTQICFGLWAISEILRLALGGETSGKRRNLWIAMYASLVLAGVLVPYHRAHQTLLSPTVFVLIPTILATSFFGTNRRFRMVVVLAAAAILLGACWSLVAGSADFAANYGHFAELLKAKIRHFNVKPADPTLLSFDARVLWTPAMHSATRAITNMMFPAAIYGLPALILAALPFKRTRRALIRGLPRSYFPIFMCVVYFVGYVFIVRYHVFCVLFLCVALPIVAHDWWRSSSSMALRGVVLAAMFILFFGEAKMCSRLERSYHASYLRETAGLLKWLRREGVAGKTILADFTLSPLLKGYCGAGIILQPKYEFKPVRDNYERFIKTMYLENEEDLNRFCLKNGAELMIYDRGYGPSAPLHIYSPRYFAAAVEVSPLAPARRMFTNPDGLNWFYRIEPPADLADVSRKFTVFKVISPLDRMNAMRLALAATEAKRDGQYRNAAALAKMAFTLDPRSEQAYLLYYDLFGKIPKLTLNGLRD